MAELDKEVLIMEYINKWCSSIPSDVLCLHPENKRKMFRQQNCYCCISALLHGQRDEKPFKLSHILFEDLGEIDGCYKVLLKLYGEPSEFYPLCGKIRLKGFIEEEYEYDIRYLYEMTTDRMIEAGIATTVEEQEKIYYEAIAEDMKHKGMNFGEMCSNTLKFIEGK